MVEDSLQFPNSLLLLSVEFQVQRDRFGSLALGRGNPVGTPGGSDNSQATRAKSSLSCAVRHIRRHALIIWKVEEM
jgi:hypothetical protein